MVKVVDVLMAYVLKMTTKKNATKRMQTVSDSIKTRGPPGQCPPITQKTCTGKAKTLAKTFKKIAAKRKKK